MPDTPDRSPPSARPAKTDQTDRGNPPHQPLQSRGPERPAVLAFDYGLKHIGVATGQTITGTASGIATVRATNGKPDWRSVMALVKEWRPGCCLVGLPLNMDDSESDLSKKARAFAAALAERAQVPVELVDERLTTREGRHLPPAQQHEHAAVLIAESWLANR